MRLFVALLPPPAAAGELAGALHAVRRRDDASALRWTQPGGWHFTLAFLGEVPDGVRPGLDERLGRAARRHGPHTLRLSGAGRFGERALWVGAEGDLAGVAGLADSVRAAGRRAGAPADEGHGFQPHLTVARSPGVRRTAGTEAAAASGPPRLGPLAEALAGFRGSPWTADTLSLVSSVPPRSGVPGEQPRYETVRAWPLGRGSGGPADEGTGSGG
ncbi:RNA 2',3'-cyclic phosphodiesterase [Streptomyces polygonati]|uniref:RNA 2',3'-cyclic phosphodiesterase n=1 Tax=Streptomyces polygonati TaxID=1617087 RepID=A0ABV8HR77_9ACTN